MGSSAHSAGLQMTWRWVMLTEWWNVTHWDLEKLEKQAYDNLKKFNKFHRFKVLHLVQGNQRHEYRLEIELTAVLWRRTWGSSGWKPGDKPIGCTCSLARWSFPSALPLGTSPGVWCLAQGPPAQDMDLLEGVQRRLWGWHRAGAPLLQAQAETAVVVQHGEEKVKGDLTARSLQYLKYFPFFIKEKGE